MQKVPANFINWFRFSAPYIKKHRGSTIVIALPGEAVQHPNFINVVHDLALLQSLGVRMIVLQGARPQIQALLDENGIDAPIHEGIRVSTSEAIPHIVSACNAVKTELESAMSAGLADSPMHQLNLHTLSGNFVSAKPLGVRGGNDYQYTGSVRSIDTKAISSALDTGAAVLLNTLGYSSTGEVFNLSLGNLLEAVSDSIDIDKVVCFTSANDLGPGLDHQVVKSNPSDLPKFSDEAGGYLIRAAAAAVSKGISRAHVISYESDGALLEELFTHDGSGLLISNEDFLSIREASLADVSGILELIQPLQEVGALVMRTREILEQEISDFSVVDIDDTIAGCGALTPLDSDHAEIACIAVHSEFRGRGYAGKLVSMLESKARSAGKRGIFVLSTQTTHWFVERGYKECSADRLPSNRKALYSNERKPKVLYKSL